MAKKTYSVTIDEDIKNQFQNSCKENNVNQSWLIEAFMRAYVNNNIDVVLVNSKAEVKIKE